MICETKWFIFLLFVLVHSLAKSKIIFQNDKINKINKTFHSLTTFVCKKIICPTRTGHFVIFYILIGKLLIQLDCFRKTWWNAFNFKFRVELVGRTLWPDNRVQGSWLDWLVSLGIEKLRLALRSIMILPWSTRSEFSPNRLVMRWFLWNCGFSRGCSIDLSLVCEESIPPRVASRRSLECRTEAE